MYCSSIPLLIMLLFLLSGCEEKHQVEEIITAELIDSTLYWKEIYRPDSTNLDNYFSKEHRKTQFYGNVLFAEKGRIIFEKSYGYQKTKKSPEVDLENTFQIASVTKVFTAVAILMLQERGLLHVDESVRKYIPELPYSDYDIKISNLLSHTSGLGKYTHFCDNPDTVWIEKDCSINNEDVLSIMKRIEPALAKTPGKKFYYANTNYILLATILERVTGKTYHDFMRENIFDPLEMNSTRVYFRENKAELVNPVKGYESNYREANDIYLNGCQGDKGIYSNVNDMLKFDQALYTEKLVKQETLALAFKGYSKPGENNANYGFGFRMLELPSTGEKIVYHNGWWKGFRSYFIRRIDKKQTIIILTNVKRGQFMKVVDLVAYLPE